MCLVMTVAVGGRSAGRQRERCRAAVLASWRCQGSVLVAAAPESLLELDRMTVGLGRELGLPVAVERLRSGLSVAPAVA